MPKFRILAIDGGGIRGIIPAYWLAQLEKRLKAKDKSLLDVFDLIAGTSTGSIIAAGIATGRTAQEMLDLYKEEGRNIFRKQSIFGLFSPTYSPDGLEKILAAKFDKKKLSDVTQKPLLIPTFNGGLRRLKLFDSSNIVDDDLLLSDIIRASCAAPTYFPAKNLKIDGVTAPFLDGGVTANNPAAIALTKALNMGHSAQGIFLLSLGTGVSQKPITASHGAKAGLARWARPIVDIMFDGSSAANERVVDDLLPGDSYVRLQKFDLQAPEALDRTDAKHLEKLEAEASNYLKKQASKEFENVVKNLLAVDLALALEGKWKSEYSWWQKGKLESSTWSETVQLDISGQIVRGETVGATDWPYTLEAKIFGNNTIVGQTTSMKKKVPIMTTFILRINEKEDKLSGRWCGTGDEMSHGEWTLTKL